MDEAIKEYTPTGKIKRPSYSLVAIWVKEAWNNIDPTMIQRSFKCYGVSTKTDGSEDDSIFDFEKVLDEKNVRIGIEKEGENNGKNDEDSKNDLECDYYENEEEIILMFGRNIRRMFSRLFK